MVTVEVTVNDQLILKWSWLGIGQQTDSSKIPMDQNILENTFFKYILKTWKIILKSFYSCKLRNIGYLYHLEIASQVSSRGNILRHDDHKQIVKMGGDAYDAIQEKIKKSDNAFLQSIKNCAPVYFFLMFLISLLLVAFFLAIYFHFYSHPYGNFLLRSVIDYYSIFIQKITFILNYNEITVKIQQKQKNTKNTKKSGKSPQQIFFFNHHIFQIFYFCLRESGP